MSGLSAALIVRDESRFIEGCLESLVGRVDEIVLVDTGSRDDTVEKARRFPVALYHFAWCDDFAAARNFALEKATQDWILYIDADERFQVPTPAMLRDVLADDRKVGWRLRFRPRLDWTPYAELRLFRNDPRIRFRGAIHERMHEGIEAVMRADGLEIGDCDIALQHVGYEDDQSRKNPRNIPLLRDRLQRDPDHLYSLWHLGQCLHLAGDDDGALAAWSQGMAVARSVPAASRCISDAQSAAWFIKLQIARGVDVSSLLNEQVDLYPENLSLVWIKTTSALERHDSETAGPLLEALVAIDPDTFFDPRVSYDKAMFHLAKEALALCRFRQGRYREAARWYRLAAEHSPDPASCELKARLAELRAAA
jgi:tetratricopeptide (TPR) repeat protein